jgi:hypothetical protein
MGELLEVLLTGLFEFWAGVRPRSPLAVLGGMALLCALAVGLAILFG